MEDRLYASLEVNRELIKKGFGQSVDYFEKDIDILGHSGSPDYAYDIDVVVQAAKDANKCIEINSHTYIARKSSWERCREIALACKRLDAPIVVNSDSHFMSQIGDLGAAINMLEEIDFPEDLIMNLNSERFTKYIENKKNKKFDFGE